VVEPVAEPEAEKIIYNVTPPKPNRTNKRLKTAFFSILGACCLLVVLIFVVMIVGTDSPVDIGEILEGEPRVGDEVKTDWDKGEYSLNSIGNASSVSQENVSYPLDGETTTQEQSTEQIFSALESDLLGAWEVSYEHNYIGIEFFDDGTLRYAEIDGDEKYDKTIDYEVVSKNEVMLANDTQNIVLVRVEYEAQFEETYLILGPENGLTELSKVSSLAPPNYLYETQPTIGDFIYNYSGYYENNSGDMDLEINIYEYEPTNESNIYRILAEFSFSPKDGNTTAKSGEYAMSGEIEIRDDYGAIWLNGDKWISEMPAANYNMLDIEGVIDLGNETFNGRLKRDNKPNFYLSKE